jgi:hypothetical protein
MVDLSMITARRDTPLKVGEFVGDSPEHWLLESVIYVLAHPKDRSTRSEKLNERCGVANPMVILQRESGLWPTHL